MSEEWGFPTSLLNSIKNCKPQEHIFWNCSAASRTNSRRRQVSTDNTLPKYILTAQVTWSIFHGKTEALKLLLTSAHAVGSSLLLKDHGSCRLHYFKSWDSLASKDLLCLDSAMEVLDSEQKSYTKAPRLLVAELRSRKSQEQLQVHLWTVLQDLRAPSPVWESLGGLKPFMFLRAFKYPCVSSLSSTTQLLNKPGIFFSVISVYSKEQLSATVQEINNFLWVTQNQFFSSANSFIQFLTILLC